MPVITQVDCPVGQVFVLFGCHDFSFLLCWYLEYVDGCAHASCEAVYLFNDSCLG